MANVRKIFDRYKVQYTSSKRSLPLASITCYSGETPVGLLEFVETAGELRDPFIHQPSGMIFLPYLLGRFHDVLDLLRNEDPLELYFNPDGKWASILTSGAEPVGEGE
jgi:hypothetical protein